MAETKARNERLGYCLAIIIMTMTLFAAVAVRVDKFDAKFDAICAAVSCETEGGTDGGE